MYTALKCLVHPKASNCGLRQKAQLRVMSDSNCQVLRVVLRASSGVSCWQEIVV